MAQKHNRTGVIIPIVFGDPRKNSKFAKAVLCEAATELGDFIITTGKMAIHPLVVKTKMAKYDPSLLKTAIVKLATDLAAHYDDPNIDGLEFATEVIPYSAAQARATAQIIAQEVNVFTDSEGRDTTEVLGQLNTVLSAITPDETNTTVVTARTTFLDDEELERKYTVHLYFNTVTGQAVVVWMIEGTM